MRIGLEIHCQLKSASKLFCACPTNYLDVAPNTNICAICSGQPGAKPMGLNERAVAGALIVGLALGCDVEREVAFMRKHYFYPDLPTGYQRTSRPLARGGSLRGVRIREIHLEEDPGRYEPRRGLVDYNRAGIPLIEIVTEPDIATPAAARGVLEDLAAILAYLGVVREEPGSVRIDANISTNGTRVEVKNINSFKGVYTALAYEVVRQANLAARGKVVARETRHFDEAQGITLPLRTKEFEADYRYIVDPDVPPLKITDEMLARARERIPELPHAKAERFVRQYKIPFNTAWIICAEPELADLFEEMAKTFAPQKVAFWIRGPLKKQLNWRGLTLKESGLRAAQLAELFGLWQTGKITDRGMEKILIALFERKEEPSTLAQQLGLLKIEALEELEGVIKMVLAENEEAIADYLAGEEKALNALIGEVVRRTGGRADPRVVKETILRKIKS